jgi:hypothetical protein
LAKLNKSAVDIESGLDEIKERYEALEAVLSQHLTSSIWGGKNMRKTSEGEMWDGFSIRSGGSIHVAKRSLS